MSKKSSTATLDREPKRESLRDPVNVPKGRAHGLSREGKVVYRTRSSDNIFAIPADMVPHGWTYEWKTARVYNDFMASHIAIQKQNGWENVFYEDHPGFFDSDDKTGAVEIGGQYLMRRPIALTLEAMEEDRRRARNQVSDSREAFKQQGRQAAEANPQLASVSGVGTSQFIAQNEAADFIEPPQYQRK